MKFLTKLFTIIIAVALLASCSDDDESNTEIALQDASIAFDAENPPVEIPTNLQNLASTDANASQIVGNLSVVNSVTTSFSQFFEIPSGATESNTPIGRSTGGRLAAEGDVAVYTYTTTTTDPETGESVTLTAAYQITDLGEDFLFEYFFQFGDGEYFKFLEARESKSELREGYLRIFYSAFDGEETQESTLSFEWSENNAGVFNFSYFTDLQDFRVDVVVNPDNSGAIELFEGGSLFYFATWNGDGTGGTYAYYDGQGNETDAGTWPQ